MEMDCASRIPRTGTRAYLPLGHCDGTVMKPKQCRYSENQIVESSVKLTTLHCQLSILEVELTTQLLQSYCILIMGHVCLAWRYTSAKLKSTLLCVMCHGSITVAQPVAFMAHMVAGKYLSVKILYIHF